MAKPSLMRSFVQNEDEKSVFQVFLHNGVKLTGKIKSVEDNTFIIECDFKGRSLVYFSKVSSVTILLKRPAEFSGVKINIDDNIGNRADSNNRQSKSPEVVHKKRSRYLGNRNGNPAPTPCDIEQQRFNKELKA